MSARAESGRSLRWLIDGIRQRWKKLLVLEVALVLAIPALLLVPIGHAQSEPYLVAIPVPTSLHSAPCSNVVFDQGGTYSFTWLVPNDNPTTLTVYSPTGSTLFSGVTAGGSSGSVPVDYPHEVEYRFCLSILSYVAPGPDPQVTVNGRLAYTTSAPLL